MLTSLGRFMRVFNGEFEKELVELLYINDMQNRFEGLTVNGLRLLAFQFSKGNNLVHPFLEEQKQAGRIRSFMRKHQLTLRRPERTSM